MVKKEITRDIQNYFKLNEHESITIKICRIMNQHFEGNF